MTHGPEFQFGVGGPPAIFIPEGSNESGHPALSCGPFGTTPPLAHRTPNFNSGLAVPPRDIHPEGIE
jgi:hypothetical protein